MASQSSNPVYPVNWTSASDLQPVESFVSNFYRVSDISGDIEEWLTHFTKDAVVQIGANPQVSDPKGLRDLRVSMWNGVKTRKHTVTRVFAAKFPDWPADDLGFTAFGYVRFESSSGGAVERNWLGIGQLRKEDGVHKLANYQVYSSGIERPTS